MRPGHSYYRSPARLLGNILALVVIAYLVMSLLAWLGFAAPVSCQLGRGMGWLLASHLLEALAMICLVAWLATRFTWHAALLWALIILFGLSWAAGQDPALLAAC